jgi:hypothetical protein
MAAAKPEVLVSQFLGKIAKKFQSYSHVLGSKKSVALLAMLFLGTGSEKFKMAVAKIGSTFISASIQDSKEIPEDSLCFQRRGTQWRYWLCTILKPEVRNSRWRLETRITCILTSMQDSKEVPTAVCIFLVLSMSMTLSGRLHLETGSEKFNWRH